MRAVQAVSVFILLVSGCGLAQNSASHTVSVRIPSVLRLRIDGGEAQRRAEEAIRIRVHDGAYAIEPSRTQVRVIANSAWQLHARYEPSGERDAAAKLMWHLGSGPWHPFSALDTMIAAGTPASGREGLSIVYGLEELPAEGNYRGVVTYTLTRP